MPRSLRPLIAAGTAMCLLIGGGCGRRGEPVAEDSTAGQINGAGATFPYPLYSKWFAEYNRLHPEVRINYQSLGSGAGIRQLMSGTISFGATDQPIADSDMALAGRKILHFPTVLGAVVPIYNLPGLRQPVKFTGPSLVDIVLGRVQKWNHPSLVRENPGVQLPDLDITFVHRSDSSGTTFILADYLRKISPEFAAGVGIEASLRWPVGVGAKGNEGVAGLVRQTPGALGYVELVYAAQNGIASGMVRNAGGEFIAASVESIAAAAAGAPMPADFRVSITNAAGSGAYPISSYTWLLLWEEPAGRTHLRQMRDFLVWALTDGQQFAPALSYAPIPPPIVARELRALEQVKVQ